MKMSRMLSLATAAALLASMSLPAFAAEIPVEIPQRVISEEEILAAAQPQVLLGDFQEGKLAPESAVIFFAGDASPAAL